MEFAHDIQMMGAAAFVKWGVVDNWCDQWAKAYFGDHVKAVAERDADFIDISITGLLEQDRKAFSELFQKCDRDGCYEPDNEFQTGSREAVLPHCITLAVLNGFAKEMNLRMVGDAITLYPGVCFTENKLQCDR